MIETPSGNLVPGGTTRPAEMDDLPPVGQAPLVMVGLTIGILLMAIQLWLLTVALDLYLAGQGGEVWRLGAASGFIFVGGLGILRILRRRPRIRGTTVG
jgi:hypothetical protein